MFWIFANDKDYSLAPNNTALGTTFANGGRNFHYLNLLTCGYLGQPKVAIIHAILISVYIFTVFSAWFTRQSG